jgi:tetratricopeptide (TPR) repeat protein
MAARRSGEPRSWLLIAETLNRPEDLPERLQALDRANEMNPRLVEAHVLRAKLLTQAKRYDEARAACRPEIFGGELPIPLRGAAAVIEAENYNSVLALELMNSIVAEDPNNYEAWTQMADWTANVYGRQDDNLRAANELVRILPNSAVSWGYLGAARRFNIDHPGAKEAFKRALALSPNYDFGAFSLFDLQLNDGEIDAAKKTLELLKLHVRGDWVIERELEFAVKAKDAVTAARLFRYLCQETAAERGVIEQAIKPMYWNDMEEQVESILDECLEISTANPVVGEVWADRWIERGNHDHCRKRLESCAQRTAVWTRAAAHYLEKKPPTERSAETFQFMQDNSAILHADDNTWGLGGYALYEFGRYQEVVEWCSDWRSRTSVKPWMLWNYVLALRELKRDAEAYEVGQAALTLAPDDLYDDHRVMIALHDALSNEADKAAERLRQIRYDCLRGWTKFNYNTAVILVRASSTSASKLIELGELAGLRRDNPFFWKDRLLFAFHWRGTLRIAEWSNNVLVKLWAYWFLGRLYLKNSFVSAQESPAWSSFRMWTGT